MTFHHPWGDCVVEGNEREGHQSRRWKADWRWFELFDGFIIHPGEPNKKWLKPCRDECQFPFETDLRCWKTRKNLEDARYKQGVKSPFGNQQNHSEDIFYQDEFNWSFDLYTLEISILKLQITLSVRKGTSYTNLRFWVPNVNFQGCIKILMTMVNWPTILKLSNLSNWDDHLCVTRWAYDRSTKLAFCHIVPTYFSI